MATSNHFGPGLLKFLRDLRANNDRDWFNENKDRYEKHVREPALQLIRDMERPLAQLSRRFVAEDKKVGGSLMRIHRDVRFGKDKSPYKINLGVQFRHEAGKDVHAPGFYLHVDPDSVFLGAGMWHPESSALAAVRESITTKSRAWIKLRDDSAFTKHWTLEGDSLKRAPKGYDPEHPMIIDLRRKDHIAVCNLTKKDVTRKDLVAFLTERFRQTKPYMRFLTKAVGLEF